jgi:hypothetical protein
MRGDPQPDASRSLRGGRLGLARNPPTPRSSKPCSRPNHRRKWSPGPSARGSATSRTMTRASSSVSLELGLVHIGRETGTATHGEHSGTGVSAQGARPHPFREPGCLAAYNWFTHNPIALHCARGLAAEGSDGSGAGAWPPRPNVLGGLPQYTRERQSWTAVSPP